jgi:NAD(P)H-flavin reductase
MRARGQALLCCATALGDVELEVDVASLSAIGPAPRSRGVVERMERLAPDVMRLWVALPGGRRLDFTAGQYINIVLEDGARRAFSFANPPHDNERIELHVRRVPGGRFTTHVFEHMRVGESIEFEGPIGRFKLHKSERPILFIAGATGFAPIRSIVEDAFRRGIRRPMWLYWGVRERKDLYMTDLALRWQREHPDFHFVPVLSEAEGDAAWQGRRGLVHEALLADHPDLGGFEVYACGSTRMVEAAVPDFLAHGLGEEFCHSDAFTPSPAPRPAPQPDRAQGL